MDLPLLESIIAVLAFQNQVQTRSTVVLKHFHTFPVTFRRHFAAYNPRTWTSSTHPSQSQRVSRAACSQRPHVKCLILPLSCHRGLGA